MLPVAKRKRERGLDYARCDKYASCKLYVRALGWTAVSRCRNTKKYTRIPTGNKNSCLPCFLRTRYLEHVVHTAHAACRLCRILAWSIENTPPSKSCRLLTAAEEETEKSSVVEHPHTWTSPLLWYLCPENRSLGHSLPRSLAKLVACQSHPSPRRDCWPPTPPFELPERTFSRQQSLLAVALRTGRARPSHNTRAPVLCCSGLGTIVRSMYARTHARTHDRTNSEPKSRTSSLSRTLFDVS